MCKCLTLKGQLHKHKGCDKSKIQGIKTFAIDEMLRNSCNHLLSN